MIQDVGADFRKRNQRMCFGTVYDMAMKECTYINEPVDLGCYKMVLKDHFQLFISGWVEPFKNVDEPRVPFNFGENTEDSKYKVNVYLTLSEFADPVATFSSDDKKGIDGQPSVILKTGTDAKDDPSVIAVDAPFSGKKEFKYLKDFLLGITLINPEGAIITTATAAIENDWRNYS